MRKASNLFPAERGMKGLAFALDPDGYWIEIAACPVNSDLQEIKVFGCSFHHKLEHSFIGGVAGKTSKVSAKVRREKLGWSDAWTQKSDGWNRCFFSWLEMNTGIAHMLFVWFCMHG